MNQIRPWLYIGNYADSLNLGTLDIEGITALLQLSSPVRWPGVESLYLRLRDGMPIPKEQLAECVRFVRQQKALDKKVLVACGAGISRSAAVCIAVLHEEEGLGLLDAYRVIHAAHPFAFPHPEFWKSLAAYYKAPENLQQIWDAVREIHHDTD